MAALARAASEEGPSPLDGLHPDALAHSVKEALAAGLVDDLDWLTPTAAGLALYDLASALPPGHEQRDLGRRVLSRLHAANAEGFAALATRMAQTTGKGLSNAAVRARIALVAELPLSLGVRDGPLALALVSRRELAREWIAQASTRSLPSRRLAARLIERAARESSKRAAQGDPHAFRAFGSDAVKDAWARLLADRESLVWRHVAVARGLVAPWMPEARKQIEASLKQGLTPTEWRRGATSLAAMCAVQPDASLRATGAFLALGVYAKDPGIASAFVWGLARAAEAEPEATQELLGRILEGATSDVAEAVLELRAELGESAVLEEAASRAVSLLTASTTHRAGDDGGEALYAELIRDLERPSGHQERLHGRLARGLVAFAQDGAKPAYLIARELLEAAQETMRALEVVAPSEELASSEAGQDARRTALVVLRDLDMSLLERSVVADLLHLGPAGDAAKNEDALDGLRERMTSWILARETPSADADAEPEPRELPHPTLRLRRLRTLLHLVDSDLGEVPESSPRATNLRARGLRVARGLSRRYAKKPAAILRRTLLATLARTVDALVRVEACDVADALLSLAMELHDAADFETMAEASMDPDLIQVLERYARFVKATTATKLELKRDSDAPDSLLPPARKAPPGNPKLHAIEELAAELTSEVSGRLDALRAVVTRLHAALVKVESVRSLRALSSAGNAEPDVIVQLESAAIALAQMCIGARGRLEPERTSVPPASTTAGRFLSLAVARVLTGAEASLTDAVLRPSIDELTRNLPPAMGRVVAAILWGLAERPLEPPSGGPVLQVVEEVQLPAWVPARRTIGGFYVLRPLGTGGAGSVFIVNRVEDRHDPNAERFALKVPDYSVTAARSISEQEFLQLFRAEASALLTVPSHPNLARFVTFDLAARPKPILVMELVEGISLERMIESGAIDMSRCLGVLEDVAAGLEAMHGVGVGHLDLKPSNVVLRRNEQPVLVDFGLAGRHIRPGCATGPYGAPEVWGAIPDGVTPTPMAADVYAFGCLAFEALTGKLLFDAGSEVAQVAMHIAHDGFPPPVKAMAGAPGLASLAELLFSTLRRDARQRPTVREVRAALKRLKPSLAGVSWPLQVD